MTRQAPHPPTQTAATCICVWSANFRARHAAAPYLYCMISKRQKRWLLIGIPAVLILLIAAFWVPRMLVAHYLDKAQDRLQHGYGLRLRVDAYEVLGFNGLSIRGLSIQPESGTDSTRVRIDSLQVRFGWWSILTGSPRVRKLDLYHSDIYLAGLPRRRRGSERKPAGRGFSQRVYPAIRLLFDQLPDEIDIRDFRLRYRSKQEAFTLYIPSLVQQDSLAGQLHIDQVAYRLSGRLDAGEQALQLQILAPDTRVRSLPLLSQKAGLKLGYQSLRVELAAEELEQDEITLNGKIEGTQIGLYQRRLNRDTSRVARGSLQFACHITPTQWELDSSSTLRLNDIRLKPYLRYEKKDSLRTYELACRLAPMRAQALVDALPVGAFGQLEGMQAKGKIGLDLHFLYTTARPDTVVFDLNLHKEGFRVTRFGRAQLGMLNAPFTYQPYGSTRRMTVGPENPNFMVLGDISRYLINAVHYSEDGQLFYGNGLNLEAFRQSIIKNIKTRGFSRGGSTISMQLIKNVFLSREKTVARKLEEIILTWLLVENHLVKPERLMEVYLNIIEWGPGVYGAQEAASYYFEGDATFLTLEEGVFLAMIVPSPRSFYYFINDSTYAPDKRHQPYFDMMGRILHSREIISEAEAEGIDCERAKLKGAALADYKAWQRRRRKPESDSLRVAEAEEPENILPDEADTDPGR